MAIAVGLIAGTLYLGTARAQADTSTSPIQHTLLVSGIGVVKLSPDQVQIILGASTQASTVQAAAAANSGLVSAVLDQLHSLGISNNSISTLYFNIYPSYDYSSSGQGKLLGYQVVHELQVTLVNADTNALGLKAGQVIDAAVSAGINQVSGVQFTISDQSMKQASTQALQQAIQDASGKANVMASALGVRVTGVLSAMESPQYSPPIYYSAASPSRAGGTQILPPNSLSVSTSVQVTYSIA